MGTSLARFKTVSAVAMLVWVTPFLAYGAAGKSYYPLKEGMTWQYQSSLGVLTVKNLAPRKLAGKTVTPQQVGGDLMFIVDDDTGIYDFAKQSPGDPEPRLLSAPYYQYVQKPVAVGTTWEDQSETTLLPKTVSVQRRCTIDMIDDVVTVPAGTFKNCVRVRCAGSALVPVESRGVAEVSVETYNWYAPGVGRVRWTTREKSNNALFGPGGEFSVDLASFSK
jgi:hypothetical protein